MNPDSERRIIRAGAAVPLHGSIDPGQRGPFTRA